MTSQSRFLAILLVLLPLFAHLSLGSDQPILLVQKALSDDILVAKRSNVLKVAIYNVGNTSAYDVHLLADTWDNQLFSVNGVTTAVWERIGPGENVTHSYVVSVTEPGVFATNPAKVTYRSSTKSTSVKTVYSSKQFAVPVLRRVELEGFAAPSLEEWGYLVAGAVASSLVPLALYLHIKSNYENGLKKKEKKGK